MTTAVITLTDLPGDMLYEIFSYLSFIDRINAQTLNKKMTAFQSSYYPHIFDRICAAFKTPFVVKLLTNPMLYKKDLRLKYFIEGKLFDNRKIISYNNDNYRELPKKYMSKFEYLFDYVCRYNDVVVNKKPLTDIDMHTFINDKMTAANSIKLTELLAELIYTRRGFTPCELDGFQYRLIYLTTIYMRTHTYRVFERLLCILLMSDTDNKYYYWARKYGVDLTSEALTHLIKLYPHMSEIRSYSHNNIHEGYLNFVNMYFCCNDWIIIYSAKGFDPIDCINYYRPSALCNFRNLKKEANQFCIHILYEGNQLLLSHYLPEAQVNNIYDRLIIQSNRNDADVYQQALVDSKLYSEDIKRVNVYRPYSGYL